MTTNTTPHQTLLGALNERDASQGMTVAEKRQRALGIGAKVMGVLAAAGTIIGVGIASHQGEPHSQPANQPGVEQTIINHSDPIELQEAGYGNRTNLDDNQPSGPGELPGQK